MRQKTPLHKLPIVKRTRRRTNHRRRCCVCLEDIVRGSRYHCGPHPRYAHLKCAEHARERHILATELTAKEMEFIADAEAGLYE
jgi:hypothetical protein